MMIQANNLVCERGFQSTLNLSLGAGECWAVVGENGVGKTTLLKTLAGLLRPKQGSVSLNGRSLLHWHRKQLAQSLGILFQGGSSLGWGSVLDVVLTGYFPHLLPWQRITNQQREYAEFLLDDQGLIDKAAKLATELSGGEQQRLLWATLKVQDPKILFLDEVTTHLDRHYQEKILTDVQRSVREQNKLALLVLHDAAQVQAFCSHRLILKVGELPIIEPLHT